MKRNLGRDYSIGLSIGAFALAFIAIMLLLAVFGSVIGKIITFLIAAIAIASAASCVYCLVSDDMYEEYEYSMEELPEFIKETYF